MWAVAVVGGDKAGIRSNYTQWIVILNIPAVLHLAKNNLTKLDSTSFRGMRFMRRLYFDDNQISSIGRQTFQAMGRIGGIHLRGNK